MSRVCGTWFDQKRVCRVPCPGLTKEGFAVSWFDQKVDQGVPCLRNPCQQTRPGDKLSCRKPAGPATGQSLSAGYFLNPAQQPYYPSSHYGRPSQDISGLSPDTAEKEEDGSWKRRRMDLESNQTWQQQQQQQQGGGWILEKEEDGSWKKEENGSWKRRRMDL